MKKISQIRLNKFAAAAEDFGYLSSEGSREKAEKSEIKYEKAKEALIKRIEHLESSCDNFPFVLIVSDYHEFEGMLLFLKKFLKTEDVRYREIDCNSTFAQIHSKGRYAAIFWQGEAKEYVLDTVRLIKI